MEIEFLCLIIGSQISHSFPRGGTFVSTTSNLNHEFVVRHQRPKVIFPTTQAKRGKLAQLKIPCWTGEANPGLRVSRNYTVEATSLLLGTSLALLALVLGVESTSGPPRSGETGAGIETAGWNQNTGYRLWILFVMRATASASADVRSTTGR